MKAAEIKDLSLADLRERIEAEKAALAKLRITHTTSPVENASVLKKARRTIARMMTILNQRENANN